MQIGPWLPSSCEASLPVEGPDGWPCYLKTLYETTLEYIRTHGQSQHEEMIKLWRPILGICAFALVFEFLMIAMIRSEVNAKIAARKREKDEDTGKKERSLQNTLS